MSERDEPRPRENPFAQPVSTSALTVTDQRGAIGGVQVSEAVAREGGNSARSASNTIGGTSAVVLQVQEAAGNSAVLDPEEQKIIGELTEEEKAIVEELKERDREVRAHENAHAAVGQGYAGTPTYEYVRGPDGVQYAVGGQVQIDVSPVPNDPEATIEKMEVVRSAALAPAQPSGQDRAVAAAAEAAMREAQAELNEEKKEELQGGEEISETSSINSIPVEDAQSPDGIFGLASGQLAAEQQASLLAAQPAGINLLV